ARANAPRPRSGRCGRHRRALNGGLPPFSTSGSYAGLPGGLDVRERRGLMRATLLRAGLVVSLFGLAACGGGGQQPTATATTTTMAPKAAAGVTSTTAAGEEEEYELDV